MKKTILLTVLFTLLLIVVTQLSKAQTLVASYPFNGNANDATGNPANNGTVQTGATLTTDRFGNANSAYNFDGVGGYIIGSAANYPTGNRTVSLWFNADAGGIALHPGILGYGGGACGTSFITGINNATTAGKYQLQGHCLSNPNQYAYPAAPESNWYNWVITVSGTTSKMYINGVLVSTAATFTTATTVAGTNFIFGNIVAVNGVGSYGVEAGNISYFKGKLDDIQIYTGALSDAQVFDAYVNDLRKPGSGNTLSFDGTSRSVTSPDDNSWDFGSGGFALEAWINPANNTSNKAIINQSNTGGTSNSAFYFGTNYNGNGSLQLYTSNGSNWTHGISSPAGALTANKWTHVCVTRQGGVAAMYINGVSQTLTNGGAATLGIAPTINNSTNQLYIGSQNGTSDFMNGQIDELRIFKGSGLTQTQVRDWMCRKISSSHPAYANLVGYFRFDEGSGTTASGYNAKFGTLVNSPTWLTSGAALGDASAHDYVNVTKTANISHASGENFSATETSGTPAGIHVYRVDEQPNTLTGTAGVSRNNKYFGVFQVNGTSPQYTAVYNYNGNPFVNAGNENSLRLFKRADNSATTWTMLSQIPNTVAKTITVPGESTEYILGSVGLPLPVSILSFAASKCNTAVCLLWVTENEQNFSHYEVEKIISGTSFSAINSVPARNTGGRNNYSFTDNNPFNGHNFYRLKMVDVDGRFSYSNTVSVKFGIISLISIQPNPAGDFVTVKGLEGYRLIQVLDFAGRLLLQKNIQHNTEQLNISNLSKGVYVLKTVKEWEQISFKLIKE